MGLYTIIQSRSLIHRSFLILFFLLLSTWTPLVLSHCHCIHTVPAFPPISVYICLILTPHWWRQHCRHRGRSDWAPAGWRLGTEEAGRGWRHTRRTTHTAVPWGREKAQRPASPSPVRSPLLTYTRKHTQEWKHTKWKEEAPVSSVSHQHWMQHAIERFLSPCSFCVRRWEKKGFSEPNKMNELSGDSHTNKYMEAKEFACTAQNQNKAS